ncbi:hypothetical protein F7725_019801 [Dissostichus mawsoni]|uniref:Uncharacterized protein n=1 Tax=Dissostichus mawsoni TaxID=36200 RepID=A0A7J5YKR6_DISMA|nr:hypothetical protein F7725_019801 [Dissostichus mawsoni]
MLADSLKACRPEGAAARRIRERQKGSCMKAGMPVSKVVAVRGFWVVVADRFAVVPRHDTGCAVSAVTIEVVIRAPPAARTVLSFFALAPLATVFGGVVAMMVITSSSTSHDITLCAIHLRRSLQGVGLGRRLLLVPERWEEAAAAAAAAATAGDVAEAVMAAQSSRVAESRRHHDAGHHHAVRVDGAARRVAVVEVHGAALCGAEQVGRVAGVRAMVRVEVMDVGVIVQAIGYHREPPIGHPPASLALGVYVFTVGLPAVLFVSFMWPDKERLTELEEEGEILMVTRGRVTQT